MKTPADRMWKEKLKNLAQALGFVAAAFTSAEPVREIEDLLLGRFKDKTATPFEEKEIRLRIDPQAVWQDCRSVMALAYPLPLSLPPIQGEGVMSRSAVGEDYHHVLRRKLETLVHTLRQDGWPFQEPRIQVDTGPLVERALALRAGIGWVGKNQQLIIPGYGSFVALGLLLLDADIPPDEKLPNLCGDCRRCMEACPAQVLGYKNFAANQCLSYLTQSKEVLTDSQAESLNQRIFGCDSCQEACPHNQKRLMEENSLDSHNASPWKGNDEEHLRRGVDLGKLLKLTKGEFNQHYRHTAAGWRGKGILQRNAFLAMRNRNDTRLEEWLNKHEESGTVPPIINPYLNRESKE